MRVLCVEYKLVTIDYFLDQMQEYELNHLLDMIQYTDKPIYESARLISYFSISPYLKKKIPMDEFMPLPFDESVGEEIEPKQLTQKMINKIKQSNTRKTN